MSTIAQSKLEDLSPEVAKKFKYWQMRTLVSSWIAYAMFYIVRKNLSMAMPGLQADLGISKAELGIFLTLHGLIYGLSRFAHGFVVHKFTGRDFMATGLLLCSICNLIFGLNSAVLVLGVVWVLNGWFQGMGYPPMARLLPYWIPPQELATKFGLWNTSHSVGAMIAVVLCGYLVNIGWRWAFYVPSALAMMVAIFLWFAMRDTPSSVGLPEIDAGKGYEKADDKDSAEYKAFIRKKVFKNPAIWILAIANFFVYILRFAILDWGPTLLKEWKGVSISNAGWMVAAFEVAGIIGIISAGRITDKFFGGKCPRVCVICMVLASSFMFLFWQSVTAPVWVSLLFLVLAGFCIYGPQGLVYIASANIATKRASAVANGLTGLGGYLSVVITGFGVGYLTDKYGWSFSLGALIGAGVIGAAIFALAWKTDANGYEMETKR